LFLRYTLLFVGENDLTDTDLVGKGFKNKQSEKGSKMQEAKRRRRETVPISVPIAGLISVILAYW